MVNVYVHPYSNINMIEQEVKRLCNGLVNISETDSPLSVHVIQGYAPTTAALPHALLHLASGRNNAQLQPEWHTILTQHARIREQATPEQTACAERFAALKQYLADNLTDLQYWRLGDVDISAFIIGKTVEGKGIALYFEMVET